MSRRVELGFVLGVLALVLAGGVLAFLRPPRPEPRQVDLQTLPKVITISTGEPVAIEPYLEPGTTTFVEFTAEW